MYLIVDFDSTIVTLEGLDTLAEIVAVRRGDPALPQKIKEITDLGMAGEIPFSESLQQRLEQVAFTRRDLGELIQILRTALSPSFSAYRNFISQNAEQIYVVSGGFEDFILPVVGELGIRADHVFANKFIFAEEACVGYDPTRLTAAANGKQRVVEGLGLKGEKWVVGDGYTDYLIVESGQAEKFIAFTETVARPKVLAVADMVAHNFGEIVEYLNLRGQEAEYSSPGWVLNLE